MLGSIYRKFIFIALITIFALLVSIPSVTKKYPEWLGALLPTQGMRLGLDLQGGMQLTLKVNVARGIKNALDASVHDLREILRRDRIAKTGVGVESIGPNRERISFPDPSMVEPARQVLQREFPNLSLLSVDRGSGSGNYLDVGLKPQEVKAIEENAVAQSVEIIRNRIDQFGVTEPMIVRQGADEIVVQLPGVKDPQRAMDLIGKTAQLEFKLVDEQSNVNLPALIASALRSGKLKPGYSHADLNRALAGSIPKGDEVYLMKRVDEATGSVTTTPILLKDKTLMTGDAVKTAHAKIGGEFNRPYVSLSLNERGARLFERITKENVGKQLAIVLDNVVQSAPVIREPITGGQAQITGNFTSEEASDLAIVLRAGALPAPVDIVQNLTVGPSLGQDSIHAGIAAAVLGTILVVAFMLVYYRLSGVIANFALFLNLILMVAALSLFRATLTLPGIAGIILSIGMAVDSNVLIFERMREEFGAGKSARSGVEGGYDKAWWTIVDSHVTTLITAFALFLFGTGPIKGFAVTLSLGVILNLFTVLFGTRAVYDYLNVKRRIKRIRFLHLISNPGIDFIGLRKFAFAVSGALVLIGLVAFVQIYRGRADLGVDLAGGTMVQLQAEKDFQMAAVRNALSREGFKDYELQQIPHSRTLVVRTKTPEAAVGAIAYKMATALDQQFPGNRFTVQSEAAIGSSVSKALQQAALLAVAVSLAGIIVYLAWRFDLRFGVAAAIATFHDVLVVLGVFFLLHKEITLLIVTALLTLAGYSLTDTVVVFDRIRENFRKDRRAEPAGVINRSINEVLSRTVITSLTVFLVLLALLSIGGLVLHDFALALTIGVVVGTYSSIFVASPIVYIWPSRRRDRRKKNAGLTDKGGKAQSNVGSRGTSGKKKLSQFKRD